MNKETPQTSPILADAEAEESIQTTEADRSNAPVVARQERERIRTIDSAWSEYLDN